MVGGQPVTTTLAIAEGTELDHATVIKLVRTYQVDLEEFGPLRFEIQKGKSLPQGGFAKSTEHAILNESQSTLILTYMRNSDIVRGFKKRLVKAFFVLVKGAQPQFVIPQTLHEALQLSANLAKEKAELTEKNEVLTKEKVALVEKNEVLVDEMVETVEQLAIAAPKAEALDLFSNAKGMFNLRNAAKALKQPPIAFNTWLRVELGWMSYAPLRSDGAP